MKNKDMNHSEMRQSLSDLGIQSIDLNSTHLQTSVAAVDKVSGSFGNDTLTGSDSEDCLIDRRGGCG